MEADPAEAVKWIRLAAEKEHAIDRREARSAQVGHQVDVAQELLPALAVLALRRRTTENTLEVVAQAPRIESIESRAESGLQSVVQTAGGLEQPLDLLPARLTVRVPDANLVGASPVMNAPVGFVRPLGHPHDEHVTARLHFSHPREQRHDWRLDLGLAKSWFETSSNA